MQRVLGIIATNRRFGNSELMVKHILSRLPETVEKRMVNLAELKLEYCRACYKCLEPGQVCPIPDDLNFVLDEIRQADAIVLAVPVYFLGPHASLKVFADRLLGVGADSELYAGKPCVTITTYGAPGWMGYAQEVVDILPKLFRFNHVGSLLVHAALPGEGLGDSSTVAELDELARALQNGGQVQKGPFACPDCGSGFVRLQQADSFLCPLCGSTGKVTAGGLELSEQKLSRFSPEGLREHFTHWLVEMKQKFLQNREQLKEIQKPYRGLDWWIRK